MDGWRPYHVQLHPGRARPPVVLYVDCIGAEPFAMEPDDRAEIEIPNPEGAFPYTLCLSIRKPGDPRPPCTLDLVFRWLRGKGIDPTRQDALDLMRIWNGADPVGGWPEGDA